MAGRIPGRGVANRPSRSTRVPIARRRLFEQPFVVQMSQSVSQKLQRVSVNPLGPHRRGHTPLADATGHVYASRHLERALVSAGIRNRLMKLVRT